MPREMMIRRTLIGMILFGSALACACRGGSASNVMGAYDPSEVVATVGTVKITRGELEEAAKPSLVRYETEIWQMKDQTLSSLVQQKLWEAEAAQRGIPAKDLGQVEVKDKVTPPTEEEVDQAIGQPRFAQALEARLKDAKDDAQRETIRKQFRQDLRQNLLNSKQQARFQEFQASLEKKFTVTRDFYPPRVKIALKDEPVKGPAEAPVTIVEFSDFECPYCKRGADTMKQVTVAYPTQVRLAFKNFPLPMHKDAQKAAEAAECAKDQGKFWEMHDHLFANREALGVDKLKEYAGTLGLDSGKFNECLDSGKMAARITKDQEDAKGVDVGSTPTFFVNGVRITGARSFEDFKALIDRELNKGGKKAS